MQIHHLVNDRKSAGQATMNERRNGAAQLFSQLGVMNKADTKTVLGAAPDSFQRQSQAKLFRGKRY